MIRQIPVVLLFGWLWTIQVVGLMLRLPATAAQVNVLFSLENLGDLERVCLSGPSVLRHVLARKQLLDFRKEVEVAHEALVHESGCLFQVPFELCSNMTSWKTLELSGDVNKRVSHEQASLQCHL